MLRLKRKRRLTSPLPESVRGRRARRTNPSWECKLGSSGLRRRPAADQASSPGRQWTPAWRSGTGEEETVTTLSSTGSRISKIFWNPSVSESYSHLSISALPLSCQVSLLLRFALLLTGPSCLFLLLLFLFFLLILLLPIILCGSIRSSRFGFAGCCWSLFLAETFLFLLSSLTEKQKLESSSRPNRAEPAGSDSVYL